MDIRRSLTSPNDPSSTSVSTSVSTSAQQRDPPPQPSGQEEDPEDAFFVAARPNRTREIQRARMTKQQTEEAIIRRVKNGFDRLAELDEAVEAGDLGAIGDWLDVAGGLVEGFRQTRALFPADRVSLSTFVRRKVEKCTNWFVSCARFDRAEQEVPRCLGEERSQVEEADDRRRCGRYGPALGARIGQVVFLPFALSLFRSVKEREADRASLSNFKLFRGRYRAS
jgi:hypothetical protein